MWRGSYGDHGSRKYLLASLDQSLKRLAADYVDIFYSHRFEVLVADGDDYAHQLAEPLPRSSSRCRAPMARWSRRRPRRQ
jgi:aryl-alcohol dehydrogenase-like predicted oxidoreductase